MFYIPGEVLFIRIPRTGSGSTREALRKKYGPPEMPMFWGLNKHAFGSELRSRLSEKDYQSCLKVMVVRNPWARVVSLYRWLRQNGIVNKKYKNADFPKWLRIYPEHPYLNKALPQVVWHSDGVEIFRYEELEALEDRLGIFLGRFNASGSYDWRSYFDTESYDLVGSVFKADIERFGY